MYEDEKYIFLSESCRYGKKNVGIIIKNKRIGVTTVRRQRLHGNSKNQEVIEITVKSQRTTVKDHKNNNKRSEGSTDYNQEVVVTIVNNRSYHNEEYGHDDSDKMLLVITIIN